MTVTGVISAIIIGAIIGALARLILPGRQHIPIWLTILVGVVAALVGTWLARVLGIPTATQGVDWLELLVQLVVAVIGVAIVAGAYSRRGIRRSVSDDPTTALLSEDRVRDRFATGS